MTSQYLLRPLRGICQKCFERLAMPESDQCGICRPNVVDLDEERQLREYERIYGGEK